MRSTGSDGRACTESSGNVALAVVIDSPSAYSPVLSDRNVVVPVRRDGDTWSKVSRGDALAVVIASPRSYAATGMRLLHHTKRSRHREERSNGAHPSPMSAEGDSGGSAPLRGAQCAGNLVCVCKTP